MGTYRLVPLGFACVVLIGCGSTAPTSAAHEGDGGGTDGSSSSSGGGSGGWSGGSSGGSSDSGFVSETGTGNGDAGDLGLHIEGNHFVYKGATTRLLGLDHSGSEYACINSGGYGFFEGPDPDTVATAMLTWGHVNAVRLPLNEDCWLGINGVNAKYSGSNYQTQIVDYANKLHSHGLFVVLDMHWNAPGTFRRRFNNPWPTPITRWTSGSR